MGYSCTRARAHPFCISETAGRIALKFGMWFETHYLSLLQRDPLPKRLTEGNNGVNVHVRMCCISGTAGQTALKIGVWLGDH